MDQYFIFYCKYQNYYYNSYNLLSLLFNINLLFTIYYNLFDVHFYKLQFYYHNICYIFYIILLFY